MAYSNDDIRELCLDIDMILVNGDKYNDRVTSLEDLQNRLRRKAEFKEIDFQSKCEVDNSLGDLLLKHAIENNNSHVEDFLLKNGFNSPQQEQIATAINEEEEAPNVEENKSDSNEVDSSNSRDAQFSVPNEKEAKYKESKENFYTSLTKDVGMFKKVCQTEKKVIN